MYQFAMISPTLGFILNSSFNSYKILHYWNKHPQIEDEKTV